MSKRPIIVIKKKGGHGGHHGGAWKVAYADFVTAMMSLFIVLWLMNSTPQVKKAVSGYFNDPKSSAKETGTDKLGDGKTVSVDQSNAEKLKEEIKKAILKQKDLEKLAKNVEITVTNEGLRVELLEDKGGTFFESGSSKLSENGTKLLGVIAEQLQGLPNHLMIEGHTDAQPYSSDTGYTNWELSTDRANSARRLLQQKGLPDERISMVRGYADQMLRVKADPFDASNRRISLIVQWLEADPAPAEQEAKGAKPGAKGTGLAAASPGGRPPAGVPTGMPGAAKPKPGEPAASQATPVPGRQTVAASLNSPVAAGVAAGGAPAKVVPAAAMPVPAPAKAGLMDRLKRMLPGKKT